jgi:hypothetical protein
MHGITWSKVAVIKKAYSPSGSPTPFKTQLDDLEDFPPEIFM